MNRSFDRAVNRFTKNVAILGQGKNWISLINFLDRNAACHNGVWKWDSGLVAKRIGMKIVKETIKEKGTDVGLVFFEYPDSIIEQHVADLKNNGCDYILMWPHNSRPFELLSTNLFLPQTPIWNDILNKI